MILHIPATIPVKFNNQVIGSATTTLIQDGKLYIEASIHPAFIRHIIQTDVTDNFSLLIDRLDTTIDVTEYKKDIST